MPEPEGHQTWRECANEYCKRGPGGTRKRKQFEKEWGRYCSRQCGDAVRRLRHYYKQKAAAEARTVNEYGPLKFSIGLRQQDWLNIVVEGSHGRTGLWVIDEGLPEGQMIIEVIGGLHRAYVNPEEFMRAAEEQPVDRQQEARNFVKAAGEIGMPILEASRLV